MSAAAAGSDSSSNEGHDSNTRNFERPRSSPGFEKLELLEYWATPSGRKWARRRAIELISGKGHPKQVLLAEYDYRYKAQLWHWIEAARKK